MAEAKEEAPAAPSPDVIEIPLSGEEGESLMGVGELEIEQPVPAHPPLSTKYAPASVARH